MKDVGPEAYRLSLPTDVRNRYDEKTSVIGVDPYTIEASNFARDRMAWPDVTYFDVYNHLVCSSNWYTKDQMKHYKSLDAYKFFQDDWIREVLHKAVKGYHLIKAKVTHSMRVSEKPLEPWVIVADDGSIQSAHCNCMAGLAEACSHVGAVLFCLEACHRARKEVTPTDLPAYWLFPSSSRLDTQFKRVRDMNLQSASKKRKIQKLELAENICDQSCIPSPTDNEKKDFFKKLQEIHPQSAILSITDDFSKSFQPDAVRIGLPPCLHTLFNANLNCAKEDVVRQHCETVDISFSEEQAALVEKRTQRQSKCKLWSSMRAGRVTASNLHAVCHTNPNNPSISLLKKLCSPSCDIIKSAAIEWGKKHEQTARREYKQFAQKIHKSFEVCETGLTLNPDFPALGASPDGLVSCSCCQKGCLEIKCPYTLKDSGAKLETISWLKENEDGCFVLDQRHKYYYQVQCQLVLTKHQYCDFVVWAPHLPLLVNRIYPDEEFWADVSAKAAYFHKHCVLPELCCKFYSSKIVLSPKKVVQQAKQPNQFCICQGPDDGRRMIKCDSENCTFIWFHVDCIGMKRVPKGKWICKTCKTKSSRQ